MGARVDVRPLLAGLDKAADELADTDAVDAAAAQVILAAARPPRRTGALAASGTTFGPVVAWTAPHAPYVEFGTRHMRAQPFAAPAADKALVDVEDLYVAHAIKATNNI